MERQILIWLIGVILLGFAFAFTIGLLANDKDMVTGALAAAAGGLLAAPFVARQWRR